MRYQWHEIVHRAYSKKKGHVRDFSEKGPKKEKYLKICTKLDNILKKGSLMPATIACMKQLEHAPV